MVFLFHETKEQEEQAALNVSHNSQYSLQSDSCLALDPKQVQFQLSLLRKENSTLTQLWEQEVAACELRCNTSNDTHLQGPLLFQKWVQKFFPTFSIETNGDNSQLMDSFPYHNSLSPLSACFHSPPRQPINPFDIFIENQSPCSSTSIRATLLPPSRIDEIKAFGNLMFVQGDDEESDTSIIPLENDSFEFLNLWGACLHKRKKHVFMRDQILSKREQVERIIILLRILRHSISEIQMDLRLGRAVLLLFAENQYLDWLIPLQENENYQSVLMLLLLVMKTDYIRNCFGGCGRIRHGMAANQIHSCIDFFKYVETLSTVISCGITTMTTTLATILSSFVLHEYTNGANQIAPVCVAVGGDKRNHIHSKEKLQPAHLLYDWTRTSRDEQFCTKMIVFIIDGLGMHALSDRRQLEYLRLILNGEISASEEDSYGIDTDEKQKETSLHYRRYMYSWKNCVSALVDIAEHSIRFLPENESSENIGGRLVRAFVSAFAEPLEEMIERNALNPIRYAHSVSYADDPIYDLNSRWENYGVLSPSDSVQSAVRSLFVRGLVDINISRCGFGDWLVWNNLRVTPLDPLLFDHDSNYYDNPECPVIDYCVDENGEFISKPLFAARYDFSLVMLLRAWHAHWTPQSHRSYPQRTQIALKTFLLCCRRVNIPSDINELILSFVSRMWWPKHETRQKCWYNECQLETLASSISEKDRIENRSIPKLSVCPCAGCGIAMFCCEKHRKFANQDGHRRLCGSPPFQIPGKETEDLCSRLSEYNIIPPEFMCVNEETDNEQIESKVLVDNTDAIVRKECDDDSSCWESVDSTGEESQAASELIYEFFYENYSRCV